MYKKLIYVNFFHFQVLTCVKKQQQVIKEQRFNKQFGKNNSKTPGHVKLILCLTSPQASFFIAHV